MTKKETIEALQRGEQINTAMIKHIPHFSFERFLQYAQCSEPVRKAIEAKALELLT